MEPADRGEPRRGPGSSPLVQLALSWGSGADPRTKKALDVVAPPPEEACMYVLASRLAVYAGITATSRVTASTVTYLGSCVSLLGAFGRDPQACSPRPADRA